MLASTRPQATEFAPYYGQYIDLVPVGDVLEALESQADETRAVLTGVSEAHAGHRYEPGKWSVKEVVAHVIDTERIFAYRALRFARGDQTPLPGYDQDAYVAGGGFDRRRLPDLSGEFAHVRASNLFLFRSFDSEILSRRGTANGVEFTVRALVYIIAGHERHHLKVLRERYLHS